MDPAQIQADYEAFQKIVMIILGVYSWEIVTTINFDWLVITGKRKFTYVTGVYFLCRYMLLFGFIATTIAMNTKVEINCQALYLFAQTASMITTASASTLFAIRAIAIWSRKLVVAIPITIICLGQWAVLLLNVTVIHAHWEHALNTCVVMETRLIIYRIVYAYTMTFDLVVLVVSCWGLIVAYGRSDLWALLFKHGVIYFVVAFGANTIPVVLLVLNLNPAMNLIAIAPATLASVIVACRGFVSLSSWASNHNVYTGSQITSPNRNNGGTKSATFAHPLRLDTTKKDLTNGVHISMETYTMSHVPAPAPYESSLEESRVDEKGGSRPHSTTDLERGL
jgi:hypothetical protein